MKTKKRIIKFRVWDKISRKFTGGYYIRDNAVYPLCISLNGLLSTSLYEKPHRIGGLGFGIQSIDNQNDFIIQQYTGLKDKNGKEIYEGDILKEFVPYPETDYNEIYVCEYSIQFSNGKFGIRHVRKDWHFGGNSNLLEIIGNIFENPELMKE